MYLRDHPDDAQHRDSDPERGHENGGQLLPGPDGRLGLELHVAERRQHKGQRDCRHGSLENVK